MRKVHEELGNVSQLTRFFQHYTSSDQASILSSAVVSDVFLVENDKKFGKQYKIEQLLHHQQLLAG